MNFFRVSIVFYFILRNITLMSSLYVCMVIKYIIVLFVETPRKFITAKLDEEWSRYKIYHSSENKLFRALCTHKDNVNESQKPGVYRIPCECGLVYIGETGRNLSVRLKEHKTNCEKAEQDKSAVAKHTWTYDHRMTTAWKRLY